MYLVDTNVISEIRKHSKADAGVRRFFRQAAKEEARLYLSVLTLGELRRGVELIRHRGDVHQADLLECWLDALLDGYRDQVLDIDVETAQLWGALRASQPQHALDQLIAASALLHGLTVVTRNEKAFAPSGVPVLNPFTQP